MANDNEILRMVKETVGLNMSRSADFEVLAQAIRDATNESLGVNTLKRMFGFGTERVAQRLSTLDIIARYVGFPDYETLAKAVGEDADISGFAPIDSIEVQSLPAGAWVRVAYDPDRVYVMTYLGNMRFVVNEVKGSRNILPQDVLVITQLAVGHKFVVSHVVRGGVDLGAYEAARFRGLKSVEVIC